MTELTAIDLFCGSGGVTAGLKAAGWRVLAAVDIDPIASGTFQANHPEVHFVQRDISARATVSELTTVASGVSVDLVVVCAPCQPFSSQNRKRGADPRQQLIVKSLAIVQALKPKIVFFENVPGLISPSYKLVLDGVIKRLRKMGYQTRGPEVKDAASLGVPQRRRRCIMVAARSDEQLQKFHETQFVGEPRTVRDAIGDLASLSSGERDPKDPMHRARTHTKIALSRLKHIPHDGGSRKSLPRRLVLKCHKDNSGFPDVYGRMSWKDVSPTLTTGCTDITRGRFAHPSQDRAITLREAARLQTFDDSYVFQGNASQVATQIGNAVPPKMIKILARGLASALSV
jgi:DNA (cytosine-5)-methyltransferase 1